jgi:pilus assembly protein CpaB
MLKGRSVSMFLVALVFGVAAAWMANRWIEARVSPVAEESNMTKVVVAALEIPFGAKIEPSHIKTVAWPTDSIPSGSFTNPAEVEGKIATRSILPGEVLLKERVVEHLGGSTLSSIVEPSKRAITVRVNDVIGVAGFLLPGNRVDILATQRGKAVKTRTILEDMKVLAVDQTASPDKNKPVIVRAVTLEMSPEDAETLVKATSEGTLQLTLRNPLDSERVAKKEAPVVEKPEVKVVRRSYRPPVETVTVIRGTQVSTNALEK